MKQIELKNYITVYILCLDKINVLGDRMIYHIKRIKRFLERLFFPDEIKVGDIWVDVYSLPSDNPFDEIDLKLIKIISVTKGRTSNTRYIQYENMCDKSIDNNWSEYLFKNFYIPYTELVKKNYNIK